MVNALSNVKLKSLLKATEAFLPSISLLMNVRFVTVAQKSVPSHFF
ncbi:hypothetical protein [Vibrio vulnificus YJ016]|uniref:Uncharacterized protein n=1 Tax=Vibrio vulnificus (strain YJ016) TaxID=196600 RepID=Q7MD46_VIBVY|nr:hypothetical protein [Vibrio vulnificus YJ016]